MMEEMYKDLSQHDLNNRQTEGLAYAMLVGKIARSDYIEITRSSPITASRDLSHLVELGLLLAHGKTRARVYEFQKQPGKAPPPQPPGQLSLPVDYD